MPPADAGGRPSTRTPDPPARWHFEEVAALSRVAHAHGLKVHMDGARFANAVARLGCTPAQATWQAGVDILCFAVTKNGGLPADAIVVFAPDAAQQIGYHLRRAGLRRAGLVWSGRRCALPPRRSCAMSKTICGCDGMVICKRHLGRVERGDCVVHLATDYQG